LRRLAVAAERLVARDDPRAITSAFAKLESAEKRLRAAVGRSPFVDGYSWTAVDAVMQEAEGGHADSQTSAVNAVRAEARFASAIESCTRELEFKLAEVRRNVGATPPDLTHGDTPPWHS
jgi:hypothetical protein